MLRPITLTLSYDQAADWYVATDHFSTVYGDGQTADEAVRDYKTSLAEYAALVERGAADGDRFDAAEMTYLGTYLRRTHTYHSSKAR